MIIALYIAAAVIMAAGSLYWAWRSRDFHKFLAGAFFVSSGILFYLYLADVSVRLLGTGFVKSPGLSADRSIVHFILFLLCFYFGFVCGSSRLRSRGKRLARAVHSHHRSRPATANCPSRARSRSRHRQARQIPPPDPR